jgi:DNA-binding GntR family transcriptional regulator
MLSKLYEQVEPLRFLLAKRSVQTHVIQSYTNSITLALTARDVDRAAELTRTYVLEVLPSILEAYREAAGQTAVPDTADTPARYARG